jgi:WD40 repeat protein
MTLPKARSLALALVYVLLALPSPFAQSRRSLPAGHRGNVTALIRDPQGRVLSAGEDGFLAIWDTGSNEVTERFQLTPYSIVSLVLRPGRNEIALLESDPMGLCRVSAWDYLEKRRLFTLRFRDPVSYTNYSAAGSFLIVSGGGRNGVAFIHPETGEILQSPRNLSGSVAFAATGKSEKTMVSYLSSGALSYWDLETGREIRRFNAPPDIKEPVLVGSNRFLAGFESEGLVILDAVSGSVLSRGGNIRDGKIFPGDPDSTEFACLGSSPPALYHLNINNQGRLETKNRKSLPPSFSPIGCGAVIASDAIILGNAEGKILVFSSSGSSRFMETGRPQEKLLDAAVSSRDLAFITEKNLMAFIPLDYNRIGRGGSVKLEDSGGCVNIASDPSGDSSFLLWQPDNIRTFPMIKTYSGFPEMGSASEAFLDRLTFRFPLRSVSVLENKILLLDSMGNIRVINRDGGDALFSYSAIGSQDASFIDGENIILGRSAVSGNTPFLRINILTGETVPLSYPAAIGARVYRGSGGGVYGAVIQDGAEPKTAIIALHTSNPAQSLPLVEYTGEDTFFDMAETGGILASNLGGGDAAVYRIAGSGGPAASSLERSPGLPLKILDGGRRFILLDTEGNITWHDPATGKIAALFRLYGDEWTLETFDTLDPLDKEGSLIRGRLTK